jgi:hypothetical protein
VSVTNCLLFGVLVVYESSPALPGAPRNFLKCKPRKYPIIHRYCRPVFSPAYAFELENDFILAMLKRGHRLGHFHVLASENILKVSG